MGMHGRKLILARDQQLFGITHPTAALQIGQFAIAQGEKEQAQIVKAPLTVIGDVPATPPVDHTARAVRVGFELSGRPVGKGRQHKAVVTNQIIGRGHNLVDARAFHIGSPKCWGEL